MSSQILTIIDYTASVAAQITGIKAVYGTGQGFVDDPLRPGQKIQPASDAPSSEYVHWSDIPDAPTIEWFTQDANVEYRWVVPMRLWLPRVDLANMRRLVMPFYDRYLHAFFSDRHLGGYCQESKISRFTMDSDDRWAWLDVSLDVLEYVNF